ncbi:hypothetical protein DL762_002096 [Monosporascus cannonballus]|uniref:DNA mismatch repair proteins mutS family domain-containing protein n=1 Tax=Monosporascus cannonballus TaxID=155416 RepID=A0ABY0HF13_9PEZI|nr:hypothetical protein DL763_010410 [Monosporascus cannonballus]RYO91658.1 hypothetical protein DL762_002096 [Monosporascus cannonballus]
MSSPQLPAHPGNPRLSLRPSPLRASSANASHETEDQQDEGSEQRLSEDADALNEIIMAIDMKNNGNLGCSYYITAQETLFLLEDVAMAGVELVETLLLHANPTTVLISSRAPDSLADYLERGAQGVDGNRGDLPGTYVLRTLNSADFGYKSGRDKLLGLNIGTSGEQRILFTSVADDQMDGEDEYNVGEGSKQGRLMKLGTSINLDSHITILQPEFHPNSQQRGPANSTSGAKESLSVYGLFHHLACTPQGRLKLRQIFLRPSLDLDLIKERQKTISFFLRPGNADAVSGLQKRLGKIKSMMACVALLRKGIDSPGRKVSVMNSVWASLQLFAAHSLQLRDILRVMPGSEKILIIRKVIDAINPLHICQVGELITQTIDFEQSAERGRTAVKHGIDANLDELKRSYDGMEPFLTGVVKKLREQVPEWATGYVENCTFIPQLGFLTVVSLNPSTGKSNYDGEGLQDVWEHMFVAEGAVYYKNRQMKEMDEQFGDAYCMIIDREIEIIHELGVKVLEREEDIVATSEIIGELDSLLALAVGSGLYNWVAPKMMDENIIHVEGGRHPLQELVVPSFITNDCHLSGGTNEADQNLRSEAESSDRRDFQEYPSTLVLTGPNHSGKSVYIKQVALIVYLAHIGCFVPAERARIGLTDRILTRIATRESVSRNESAFSIDLRQVAFAMNFATRRSLVLVDEFGKGTSSSDGAGLVTALLSHFSTLGRNRPKVLAVTHFHEIFENHFLEESRDVAFAHMDIHIDFDCPAKEDQVTYLFQLVPGRSLSSFGTRCAAMNGIDEAVVHRAEAIMLLLVQNEDLGVACSKLSDTETQRLEDAEAVARAFLEEDIMATPRELGRSNSSNWFRSILTRVLSGDSTDDTMTDMS